MHSGRDEAQCMQSYATTVEVWQKIDFKPEYRVCRCHMHVLDMPSIDELRDSESGRMDEL